MEDCFLLSLCEVFVYKFRVILIVLFGPHQRVVNCKEAKRALITIIAGVVIVYLPNLRKLLALYSALLCER